MQKPINDLAAFLRNLLPPQIPETYPIDAMFFSIAEEGEIRRGVLAFRDFMYGLNSRLMAEGSPYDKPKKTAHAFADNTSLLASYPFVANLEMILLNIGLHGALSEGRDTLLLASARPFADLKMPDSQKTACLQFLSGCGFRIEGAGFGSKKPDWSLPIEITHPGNPLVLTGLKVMATAERDLRTTSIQDILLRCDYRVLANGDLDLFSILTDLTAPLPDEVKAYILQLHQSYAQHGYKCIFSTTNLYIRLTYFCRSKELWRFNISLNNGYSIGIKATNTHRYPITVTTFPAWLQEKIAKGYGCGKKRGISDTCDGGCRGYRVLLDGSFMEISDVVKTWIDKEVACIQKK